MKPLITALVFMLIVCSAAAVAGCGSGGHDPVGIPPTTSAVVPMVNTTFQWVDPLEDLRSSDATFIRAYAESFLAMAQTGEVGAVYPGFARANNGKIDLSEDRYRPKSNPVQIYQLKILRVDTLDDGSVSAILCDGVLPRELIYVRTGKHPPESQFGRAHRPKDDVFGDWYVTWWGQYGEQPSPEFTACETLHGSSGSSARLAPPIPGWPGSA